MTVSHDENTFLFRFPLWLPWKEGDLRSSFLVDGSGGEPVVPLFTEQDLAQAFLDKEPRDIGFSLQPITGKSDLLSLLTKFEKSGCIGVSMDPLGSTTGRYTPISQLRKTLRKLAE